VTRLRSASQSISVALTGSRKIQILTGVTLAVAVALSGVGVKIGENLVSATLTLTTVFGTVGFLDYVFTGIGLSMIAFVIAIIALIIGLTARSN